MFGKLLQAAERIYGFDYPGRIVIPVGVSEFEEVRNCIAAAEHSRSRRRTGGCRLPAPSLGKVECVQSLKITGSD